MTSPWRGCGAVLARSDSSYTGYRIGAALLAEYGVVVHGCMPLPEPFDAPPEWRARKDEDGT